MFKITTKTRIFYTYDVIPVKTGVWAYIFCNDRVTKMPDSVWIPYSEIEEIGF